MIANINEGDSLNQKELCKAIGIAQNTFKSNKSRILEELTHCFEYEIVYSKTGKPSKYVFTKKFYDYEYEAKNQKSKSEKDKFYEKVIPEIINEQPLNTPANMARVINTEYVDIHKYTTSEGTIYNDTLQRCHKWYGKSEYDIPEFFNLGERKGEVVGRVWAVLEKEYNYYIPLTEAQQEELKNLFRIYVYESKELKKSDDEILADYNNGTITKDECITKLGEAKFNAFYAAKRAFKDKYGGYPVRVNEYVNYEVKSYE